VQENKLKRIGLWYKHRCTCWRSNMEIV